MVLGKSVCVCEEVKIGEGEEYGGGGEWSPKRPNTLAQLYHIISPACAHGA